MDITQRKITKIAREAEKLVLLTVREEGVGTAEIDLIHALRHHPGCTQAQLAELLHADKAAIARRTKNLEGKGYLTRQDAPNDRRSQLLFPTEKAENLKSSKAEVEAAFYEYLTGVLTQEEAAERVGKSRSAVANSLRLLGLCPEVREMLQNGALSGGHARALLPLKADLQLEAAKAVAAQGLSVRQTEALAKRLANPKEERKLSNDERIAESYGRLAAQELSDKIGRTCRIVSGRKKGRIELDYYGIDDLNDLLEALAAIKRRKDGSEKE